MARPKVSFLAFFLMWAKLRRWEVPAVHVRACHWMEHRGDLAVFRAHRGFSKSTILAVYNAWRFCYDPEYRILHQSEADGTAYKTSRDTQNVLRSHPLTRGMFREGGVEQWWVDGATDPRNASMYAKGILSNVTSARADECQNDDVEVPRNIQSPEAREKLRFRLGEQTHILVPGGRQLYIGTPHTHDSIYDEQEAMGADCLTIKMFGQEQRVRDAKAGAECLLPFVPEIVFSGIGKPARLLKEGVDYVRATGSVRLKGAHNLVDFYAGVAWPERFDAAELLKRRRKTRTINEWDSQYQLHSKPIHEQRLDPDRIAVYDCEPTWRRANGQLLMMLGGVRIVGASVRWDPSGGKIKSDVSAVAVSLQGEGGERYLHRVKPLFGDVAEFGPDGKTITGGQVHQLVSIVEELRLPRITVETNGIGRFAPAVLKAALKQRKLKHPCGVAEHTSTKNKNERILETLEPLLMTKDQLWAHVSVMDNEDGDAGKGELPTQMRSWNPAVKDQPDDYLDAAAGAIAETPERIIGKIAPDPEQRGGIPPSPDADSWRPSSGVHEVILEFEASD
jgi:hypothetical protein